MIFLSKIFKRTPAPPAAGPQRIDVMAGGPAAMTPFSGNAYESDIYRGAVDAIARNAAKLKPVHVVTNEGQRKDGDPVLNRLLQVRPNPFMSTYDMLYKLVTHYFLYNNAFALLQFDDKGSLAAIYPMRPMHMEYLADPTGSLFCKFLFANGKEYIFPFNQVLTIRRHFNNNDLLGDPNTAILSTLEVAHTQDEGIKDGITSCASIRGIFQYNQVLAPTRLKEVTDKFIADYLTVKNNGGVIAVDKNYSYVPIESKPQNIDETQINAIKKKIYDYLGISESIVNSSYNEDEWSAFYESVIEPLAVQFSQEFTEKLFTQREQAFGNSILLEANRLQFASNKTKADILKNLVPMGLLTKNQALEILNLPGVEDGDKTIQSLNYANSSIVDAYQMAVAKSGKGKEGSNADGQGNQNDSDPGDTRGSE